MQRLIETLLWLAEGGAVAAHESRAGGADDCAARDSRSPFQQIIGWCTSKGFEAKRSGRMYFFFNHAAAPVPHTLVGALASGYSFSRTASVVGALHNPSLQPTRARYAGVVG